MTTLVSMFSGAGGIDEGFRNAGVSSLACMDIEEWACDTLRRNHDEAFIVGPPEFSGDIKKISPEELSEVTGIKPKEIDILAGGPPCQPFSAAASQRFLKGDERFKRLGFDDKNKGTLLFDYIGHILYFKPRVFLIENVPGIIRIDGGKQLTQGLDLLRVAGYSISPVRVTQAAEYGVPQNRQRVIIWGCLDRDVCPTLPNQTHIDDDIFSFPQRGSATALINIPANLQNNQIRSHSPTSVDRYAKLAFGQREKLGRVDRLDPYLPSKTVIAGGTHGGGRSHLHPFEPRTLSVRECARLQTFSDDTVFEGSMARQFTQVGNAVPPLLAEVFARHIQSTIFSVKYDSLPTFLAKQPDINNNEAAEILFAESYSKGVRLYDDLYSSDRFNLKAANC